MLPVLLSLVAEPLTGLVDTAFIARLGADEFAQLAARSTVGGDDIVVLMRAVRYGESWWLEGPFSQFVALLGLEQLAAGILRLGPAAAVANRVRSPGGRPAPLRPAPAGRASHWHRRGPRFAP